MNQDLPSLDQQIRARLKSGARFVTVTSTAKATNLATADSIAIFRELSRSMPGDAAIFRRDDETILAFSPFEMIELKNDRAFVSQPRSKTVKALPGEAFAAIARRVQYHGGKNAPSPGFFCGGAIGVLTYDCVRFLEPVLTTSPGNLRGIQSDASDGMLGFYQSFIVFKAKSIYLVTGALAQKNHAKFRTQLQAQLEHLETQLVSAASASALSIPKSAPPLTFRAMLGKTAFFRGIRKLKDHIRDGDIFQAVLSEKFTAPFTGDPLRCFEILARISPAPYQFYLPTPRGAFFGASPEALIRFQDGELESHPIAGTRPRGKTPQAEKKLEQQLIRSEKEKAEHLMLVDLARNDLGRVSRSGTVKVKSFMKLKKFGGVMHLVSRVTGAVREELSGFDALAACFPAGTLTGAPKIRAMQILSELEPLPRGYYGGAVIAADYAGNLDSCIAIRCIEIHGKTATIQAGAGIVADSRADREYAEIHHKSKMTRHALALATTSVKARPSPAKQKGTRA